MGDHCNSSRQTDVGTEEGESDEDSSSSSSSLDDLNSELDRFRTEWFNELRNRSPEPIDEEELDKEGEARRLFLKGIEAEREGRSGEAVYWYRRATHLCPDVESTIVVPRKRNRRRLKSRSSVDSAVESTSTEISSSVNPNTHAAGDLLDPSDSENDEDLGDLLERFRRLEVTGTRICTPQWPQQAVHISDIPTEILIRIVCWVIGKHLDIRSLDNLALSCRGFYVLTRDDQIWAKVCRSIWRSSVDKPGKFGHWREMYMSRPRVHFNGCYISKMSYVRQGEQSLDNFCQVVSIVEYFRYIRFYPDGRALMVTSPEEPSIMVYKLLRSNTIHGLLEGYYRLVEDKITIILKRRPINYNKRAYIRPKRSQNINPTERKEETYHLELGIKNCGKRLNYALVWNYYCIHTTYGDGSTNETIFDMTYQKYPPLYFSPVKSYASVTDGPL